MNFAELLFDGEKSSHEEKVRDFSVGRNRLDLQFRSIDREGKKNPIKGQWENQTK